MTSEQTHDMEWAILNAMEAHVAVLDGDGTILRTNRAWDEFAVRNPRADGTLPQRIEAGSNYLCVCRSAAGSSAENAHAAFRGIKEVLAGKKRDFVLEYPCHSAKERRWFVMNVKPLKGVRPRRVVVVHTNVTALKLAELENLHRTEELTKALQEIEDFAKRLKAAIKVDGLIGEPARHSRSGMQVNTQKPGTIATQRLGQLSAREREVLVSLARGERVTEIAKRMSLSAKSVSTYRSRVLEKLQARTNADLVNLIARIEVI